MTYTMTAATAAELPEAYAAIRAIYEDGESDPESEIIIGSCTVWPTMKQLEAWEADPDMAVLIVRDDATGSIESLTPWNVVKDEILAGWGRTDIDAELRYAHVRYVESLGRRYTVDVPVLTGAQLRDWLAATLMGGPGSPFDPATYAAPEHGGLDWDALAADPWILEVWHDENDQLSWTVRYR